MRKLICILALLPLLAFGTGARQEVIFARYPQVAASHSFSLVQTPTVCGQTANFNPTVTCTIPSTAAGNAILIFGNTGGAGVSSTTPASTTIATAYNGAAALIVANVSASVTSVVINLSNNFDVSTFIVVEVAGLTTTTPLDTSVGYVNSAFSGTTSTGSLNTTSYNANDVIIGVANSASFATQWSMPGTGYTQLNSSYCYSTNTICVWAEYKVVTSTGTYNPGVTMNVTGYAPIATTALKLR